MWARLWRLRMSSDPSCPRLWRLGMSGDSPWAGLGKAPAAATGTASLLLFFFLRLKVVGKAAASSGDVAGLAALCSRRFQVEWLHVAER